MFKKILLLLLFTFTAFANEFVQLPNGKTILLKDDGTYEEVTVIEKEGKVIALKKDGTWEALPESVPVVERVGVKSDAANAASSELAKLLIGRWESRDGSTVYEFKSDNTMRIKRDNRWKSTTYKVDDVNEKKRNIVVNIGEGSRLGFLSIGGEHRRLHIEDDNRTMHDETYKILHFKDLVLIKER